LDKAISEFEKALEFDPQDALSMVVMALTYDIKREREKAIYWLERALKYRDQIGPQAKNYEDKLRSWKQK